MARRNLPLIVPVFLPHQGCPHRCVFCNQEAITGFNGDPLVASHVSDQVESFLRGCPPERLERSVQLAFYGGNFLGLPPDNILALLTAARNYIDRGLIHGIRFSTRPDTIDSFRLSLIRDFQIEVVELGVQSMDDTVLFLSQRGHSAADAETAVARLKAQGYHVGLQLMAGLPGDDETRSLGSARKVAALSPDFVRIYPTVVLKGSALAHAHRSGRFIPWSLDETISVVKQMLLLFESEGIPVIRMGLQATAELDKGCVILGGPHHPAFGHLVYSEIYFDRAVALLKEKGFDANTSITNKMAGIRVHPRCESRMRGIKNKNVERLRELFSLTALSVIPDSRISEGQLEITNLI